MKKSTRITVGLIQVTHIIRSYAETKVAVMSHGIRIETILLKFEKHTECLSIVINLLVASPSSLVFGTARMSKWS